MSYSSKRFGKAYDEWIDIYDTNQNKTYNLNAMILRDESLLIHSKRILECGFDTGIKSEYFA